jgi:hypothetical protein
MFYRFEPVQTGCNCLLTQVHFLPIQFLKVHRPADAGPAQVNSIVDDMIG